jgi:hypothetical protein
MRKRAARCRGEHGYQSPPLTGAPDSHSVRAYLRTLYVTNFGSGQLETVNVTDLVKAAAG